MKKRQPLKRFVASKPILYFVLALIFLPLFINNASARHAETRAGWAANGIASSLHNLATSGPMLSNPTNAGAIGNPNSRKGTSEMCVYCHTPHFAERGNGPLWNRRMSPSSGPIDAYGTTIAKNEDGNANMFSTIACLSCHDGVTTFDSLINQPGKGTDNPSLLPSSSQWRFKMGNSVTGGPPSMDHFNSPACPVCHGDGDGSPEAGVWDQTLNGGTGGYRPGPGEGIWFDSGYQRLIIGEQGGNKTNLTNDHPIGVIYRGQGDPNASASLRPRTTIISGINMDIETENGAPMAALVPGNLWAVKGFISDTASIQDLLRSGTGQGSGNYVQCTSCHDAHFKNQTNPEKWFYSLIRKYQTGLDDGLIDSSTGMPIYSMEPVTTHDAFEVNGLFLRRVGGNSDSGLCRTCHDKG